MGSFFTFQTVNLYSARFEYETLMEIDPDKVPQMRLKGRIMLLKLFHIVLIRVDTTAR